MRLSLAAAAVVLLLLIACNGPTQSTSEVGAENTPAETPGGTESTATETPLTPEGPENTLVETPEYTGVIISEEGAGAFAYLFDTDTSFWTPSTDDISKAESCISQFLVSAQDAPEQDAYQKEAVAYILEHLEEYRRQYVGIVVDGEKRIWCNAFLRENPYPFWMTGPVDVDDGGKNYWQIEYDLPTDDCLNFYVHGEA